VALPAGALIAGVAGEAIGVVAVLWIGAIGGLVAAAALASPAVLRLGQRQSA
jgi:hypothetical protein